MIWLVSTWNQPCGIAEHAAYLVEAVTAADPVQRITASPRWLDPAVALAVLAHHGRPGDIVHLNWHAALHSRWTAAQLDQLRTQGYRVVVTFHDTGVPNTDQCHAICAAADAMIVHEPVEDLPSATVHYWRMGVPAWVAPIRWSGGQPILGAIGFPFGWKHYDQLARITAAVGWALLLIAPDATPEQVATWTALNPQIILRTDFVPRREAVALLAGCDASAFTYVCHNTGQSAAILLGIAARKPVLALSTCRQFRALYLDDLGREALHWCETFEDVAYQLRHLPIARVYAPMVALGTQDAWDTVGQAYAALYRSLQ